MGLKTAGLLSGLVALARPCSWWLIDDDTVQLAVRVQPSASDEGEIWCRRSERLIRGTTEEVRNAVA